VKTIALRFVKWGTGLLVLGLLTGYGPLGHYLHGGVKVACPWAPVHGHVALLGWLGMTVFGLVYRALPDWGTPSASALKLAKGHFWLAVIGVLGVWANGILGYRLIGKISPGFYYKPDTPRLNLWLSIDGWFLSLFALGCVLFMLVVFGTRFETEDREP
jgi:nitric oxide reductase large subunit